jgi:hypothetical protein
LSRRFFARTTITQLEERLGFGTMGTQDKAKHLATLYLEDISDFIVECVDANFGFSRMRNVGSKFI